MKDLVLLRKDGKKGLVHETVHIYNSFIQEI